MAFTLFGKDKTDLFQKAKAAAAGLGTKTSNALQNAKEQAAPAAGKLAQKIKDTSKKAADTIGEKVADQKAGREQKKANADKAKSLAAELAAKPQLISSDNALKVIYYLIAADGQILQEELEKFDEIGASLDPQFQENKDRILQECQAQLEKAIDEEDFYDVLQDGVDAALQSPAQGKNPILSPKMLLWDLLCVAYSDSDFAEIEQRLIKFVVRRLGIDKAVYLEMDQAVQTATELEQEANWLKTTSRPYQEVAEQIQEIKNREAAIFQSVTDLITLQN